MAGKPGRSGRRTDPAREIKYLKGRIRMTKDPKQRRTLEQGVKRLGAERVQKIYEETVNRNAQRDQNKGRGKR